MVVQVTPNLIQGVSQQHAQQRRDSQCESQFDCINSPLLNCTARPPIEFVALISAADYADAFMHPVKRDGVNYIIGVVSETPFAFNYDDGTEIGFTIGGGPNYLEHNPSLPRDVFRAQTVEDVTIIVNRLKTPTMETATTAAKVNEGFVFVRAGAFNTKYRVKLVSGANVAETEVHTVPSGVGVADEWLAKAQHIADFLVNGQAAGAGVTDKGAAGRAAYSGLDGQSGFSADLYGTLIHVYRADGADFTIETEDGNSDDFLYGFKGFIKAFERLPRRGLDGSLLEVAGEDRTRDDNYYVAFEGGEGTGEWIETVGPSVKTAFDPDTMPHKFTWLTTNDFAYGSNTWSTRVVGDEDTAPDPSFIGTSIRDVFWGNQRLGFLTDRSAVWSKVRYPYTFFPDTVQALLANAPVDIKVVAGKTNKNGVTIPDFVVKVDGATYFWAQGVQFLVGSGGQEGFKADTVQAEETTGYEYTDTCDPIAIGGFLFFASGSGDWSSIRAIQYANGKANGDTDTTAHVPSYIPSGARGFAASDTLRMLFTYADGDKTTLSVYNYLFQENTFAQSAWNKWRIPGGDILRADMDGSVLKIVQQRTEGVAILRCDLTPGAVDAITGAEYRTRLDLMVDQTQVTGLSYNATTQRTTFNLPYAPTDYQTLKVVIAEAGGGYIRGQALTVVQPETVSPGDVAVVVEGNLTGRKFFVGQQIVSERTESEFFVRTENGPIPTERLTINNIQLDVAKTGYTRIEVSTGDQRPDRDYEFFGGGYQSVSVDAVNVSNGKLLAPVGEQSPLTTIRLVNDSHLPSSWQTLAWDVTPVGGKGLK